MTVYDLIAAQCPNTIEDFKKKNAAYLSKHPKFRGYAFSSQFGRLYEFIQKAYSEKGMNFYLYLSHEFELNELKPYMIKLYTDYEKSNTKG